jgi:multicomponent Na+:H+ antiporter subunit G
MIEYVLLLAGVIIMVLGALGILRFPDVYTRLHASTKCDTGGAMSILIAVTLIITGPLMVKIKILTLMFLIIMINPMVSHAIARGAHKSGIKPNVVVDMYARDNP